MARIEVFSHQQDITGEGPLWSVAEQALYWLDIGNKKLFRKDLSGAPVRAWPLPDYPGCLGELKAGSIAVAMGAGVQRVDLKSGDAELICTAPAMRPATRFNDGKVDPQGRLWAGTMQNNFGPNGISIPIDRRDGTLYRFDADGRATVIEENIGISNTLAWSPDNKKFYFADSVQRLIWSYDYDAPSGAVRGKQIFFEGDKGVPDGSTIDAEGCLWNARWGGGVILRITPDGKVDRRIDMPVPQPTSCMFGGPDLDILFVTSATNGIDENGLKAYPLSGSVFAITGLGRGLPVPPMRWNTR